MTQNPTGAPRALSRTPAPTLASTDRRVSLVRRTAGAEGSRSDAEARRIPGASRPAR